MITNALKYKKNPKRVGASAKHQLAMAIELRDTAK